MSAFQQATYIEITLDHQKFALPIEDTREILRMQPLTALPDASFGTRGVIHLRGEIVPVVSLRDLFALADQEPDDAVRIVIVPSSEGMVGLVVDEVVGVASYGEVKPVKAGWNGGGYLSSLAPSKEGLVGILNLGDILKDVHL
ncbi:chemotaxis protein CheW [Paenibacillus jiagnxiensis]|uniref:chemotaxis protein CheW n=1 Tax=Paenibacillus jiagnxiensis TaxID=3228926 RepID=UPI00339E44B4